MAEVKSKVIASGMAWKFAERICAQGVSFIVSLILARMLLPNDYGIVAMILVFINLANVFVSNGFSVALVQKKNATDKDFSTMFFCSLVLSIVMYGILYFFSPFIADFYNQSSLVVYLRILGLKLIINSANSIQHAYVSRNMQFKKFFFSTIIGTVLSAIVGISMAYKGFGPWALVAQYLVNSIVDTCVLFVTVNWRPKLLFSIKAANKMLRFAWKVTLADFIATAYNEMRSFVIGKYFTASDLAYYNRAEQFPKLFVNNIITTVSSVLFPAMADVVDAKDKVRYMTRASIRMACYIIFPLMGGMIVLAEPIIKILLTEKWLPAVPFLQIACISYAILPLNSINVQAIKAMGEGTTYLIIELLKKGVGIVVIFLSAQISVEAVAISAVMIAFIYLVINILPNGKLLNYGLSEQMNDVLSFAGITMLMVFIVSLLGRVPIQSDLCLMIIQIIVGILVYVLLSLYFKINEIKIIFKIVKRFLKKK